MLQVHSHFFRNVLLCACVVSVTLWLPWFGCVSLWYLWFCYGSLWFRDGGDRSVSLWFRCGLGVVAVVSVCCCHGYLCVRCSFLFHAEYVVEFGWDAAAITKKVDSGSPCHVYKYHVLTYDVQLFITAFVVLNKTPKLITHKQKTNNNYIGSN